MTIDSTNFPNNPVLLHFREELHKNPATFESERNLYYVAALVSTVVAAVFFCSTLALQTMILPFWVAMAGSAVALYAGQEFLGVAGKMIQNAKEAQKAAVSLKEKQDTYRSYRKTSFSEPEKIIMTYRNLAEREYQETEQRLQKLTEDLLDPTSKITSESTTEQLLQKLTEDLLDPKPKITSSSKFEEIIQLQHQVLLLKIDLSFKISIHDAIAAGNLDCLAEKEDLFILSKQDPLERNRIQGLNEILKATFTEPLVCFKNIFDALFGSSTNLIDDYPEALTYKEVQEMHPEDLAKHMLTLMKASIVSI